jgi:osmotically inducible protein OsmC
LALSHELSQGGNEPEQLDVSAVVTLDRVDGAPTVTRSALTVTGRVPGIGAAAFEAAAQGAGRNCPISRLLVGGSAEIAVDATLAS